VRALKRNRLICIARNVSSKFFLTELYSPTITIITVSYNRRYATLSVEVKSVSCNG